MYVETQKITIMIGSIGGNIMAVWLTNFQVKNPYPGVNRIHPLKQHKLEALIEKAKKYPGIVCIVVFGSSTEERCTDYSDIDIIVKGALGTKFCPPR